MDHQYSVTLSSLVDELNLSVFYQPEEYDSVLVTTDDINRPGLQLAGFFDYFDPTRLQIIGKVETTYLDTLTPAQRLKAFERLMKTKIPALIISRGIEPFPELIKMAKHHHVTLLTSQESTSYVMGALISSLKVSLAPRITRHGVLVEVYGEGILLLGDSGVGKSETAIELVKRGHRLIADDAVEIKRVSNRSLVGTAPELIRHYIELRGIGVVDVRRIFGMGAIKPTEKIDLVINIEIWKDESFYDRLGLEEMTTTILDVTVPSLTVPVKPGRNLAVIIEVAAMNNRNKKLGYNAAREFTDRIQKHFDEASANATEQNNSSN